MTKQKRTHIKYFLISCAFLLWYSPAYAGPPFITDDPPPVDYKDLQIILFSNVLKMNSGASLAAPGLEADYGLAPNLEINMVASVTHNFLRYASNVSGLGDVQLGLKYRFIQETATTPQVSIVPIYFIPMSPGNRNLGNGRGWELIPIWLQKSWGPWMSYGGGGIALNGAPGNYNYYFGGIVIQRTMNEKWILGGEIFSQGTASTTSPAFTTINLGGFYQLVNNCSLLFSAGHSVIGANALSAYVGISWMI